MTWYMAGGAGESAYSDTAIEPDPLLPDGSTSFKDSGRPLPTTIM
jgi:hypothetical protein